MKWLLIATTVTLFFMGGAYVAEALWSAPIAPKPTTPNLEVPLAPDQDS